MVDKGNLSAFHHLLYFSKLFNRCCNTFEYQYLSRSLKKSKRCRSISQDATILTLENRFCLLIELKENKSLCHRAQFQVRTKSCFTLISAVRQEQIHRESCNSLFRLNLASKMRFYTLGVLKFCLCFFLQNLPCRYNLIT